MSHYSTKWNFVSRLGLACVVAKTKTGNDAIIKASDGYQLKKEAHSTGLPKRQSDLRCLGKQGCNVAIRHCYPQAA